MLSSDKNHSADNQQKKGEHFYTRDMNSSDVSKPDSKCEDDESDAQIDQQDNGIKDDIANQEIKDLGMRTDLGEPMNKQIVHTSPSPSQDRGMKAVFPIIRDDDSIIKQKNPRTEIAKPPPEAMQGAPGLTSNYSEQAHLRETIDQRSAEKSRESPGFLRSIFVIIKRFLSLIGD
ncbi:MAG: hypothetical protein PVG14_09185 [Anaerolineales bacterium]|jgi:hypothetical protein